jgi:hypothetical protein
MVSSRYNSRMQMSNVRNRTGICEKRQVTPREVVAWRSGVPSYRGTGLSRANPIGFHGFGLSPPIWTGLTRGPD